MFRRIFGSNFVEQIKSAGLLHPTSISPPEVPEVQGRWSILYLKKFTSFLE